MIFNSFTYLLFLVVTLSLYWFSSKNIKLYVIFLSSIIFYSFWRFDFVLLLLLSIFVDYYASIKIYNSKIKAKKRIYLYLSLFINIGLLAFFKYFYFIFENTSGLMSLMGVDLPPLELKIILPIGISFYTFQSISYTIDVYRGSFKPVKNFILFSNYVIFFPQLVAGPILRANEMLWQFTQKKIFDFNSFSYGIQRIISGLFLKVVLADNISKIVNEGFLINPKLLSVFDIMTLCYLFGFQIYFDFSAYSHIAIGSALLFGIKLKENFNFPFHSISPKNYWTRWNITLSSWVRDYIYLPLLNKKPLNKSNDGLSYKVSYSNLGVYSVLTLFITWSLMGLWHGASWNFITWGLWNFLIIWTFRYLEFFKNFLNMRLYNFISWFLTLQLTMIGWIFFRPENLSISMEMLSSFFTIEKWTFLSLKENNYLIVFLITLFYLIMPYILSKFKILTERRKVIFNLTKNITLIIAVTLILIYLKDIKQFIYFQF